ncbi:hypothetical protein ACFPOD_01590 [Nitratireductor kimnyeongensis]|uniref:YfhD family protein n=1 Tax=Nitratireductor kimnyeongensis TaxID=430679 RepID=A0ABW0T5T6_9HYPH|nr:hypothetical protein [Nitratireductor kimnyeongensis]QZZ35173.1 hypothetical protein KW403_15610 [Nitratireductor kimnyeongensis]
MNDRQKKDRASDIQSSDLAADRMGNNQLQGDDQAKVRNQRHAVPDVKQEADDVIESFEKLDKDERARRDLGKGARSGNS